MKSFTVVGSWGWMIRLCMTITLRTRIAHRKNADEDVVRVRFMSSSFIFLTSENLNWESLWSSDWVWDASRGSKNALIKSKLDTYACRKRTIPTWGLWYCSTIYCKKVYLVLAPTLVKFGFSASGLDLKNQGTHYCSQKKYNCKTSLWRNCSATDCWGPEFGWPTNCE